METQQLVTIAQGTNDSLINVPMELIDLTMWLFTLKDKEYVACSSGHNGMVQGRLPNGKRVSVSVETIGGNFIVNNFIEDISRRDHVRAVSNSIMWTRGPDGVYTVQLRVTWEFKITSVSAKSCILTCNVTADTADMEFVAMLQSIPQSDSDTAEEHFTGETPNFAADIERKALMGMFAVPVPRYRVPKLLSYSEVQRKW